MSSEKNFIELVQFDANNLENIYKRWQRWSKRLDRLLDIKNVRENNTKINYLFFYGGDALEDIYNDFAEESDKYEDILVKLNQFFRKSSPSLQGSSEDISTTRTTSFKKEEDMITFELIIDEENQKVNELIQKYNENKEKMRELEKEKKELDELIKKTIGLKVKDISTKSSSKLESNEDQNESFIREDENSFNEFEEEEEDRTRKEAECIEMLCNQRSRSGSRKHVDFSRQVDYRVPLKDEEDEDVEDDYFRMPPMPPMPPPPPLPLPPRCIFQKIKKTYLPPPPPPPLMSSHHYHRQPTLSYRRSSKDCPHYKFERLHFKKKIID